MKKVAIVILNWNGSSMMRRYLPSVISHTADIADIIVADNASTDNSLEMLRRDFPHVRLIALAQNYGFAGGYNQALRQVDNEYYMLLNSDVQVCDSWMETLLSFMEHHPEVAACQPKLRSIYMRDTFEYAGASGGYIDRYGYPFCRGRIFDTVEADRGQYDDAAEIAWATGAALMIRRADFWRVNGFDERFFAHNEEIDLCWRLRNMGRKIYCEPRSMVYHVGGGTLPKSNPMKTYLNFRNNLTMLYKNLPENELAHVMRVRFWLDYVAAFKSLLLDGNWGEFKAVLRGRRAYKSWRADFGHDRADIQASLDATATNTRKSYSILYEYYIKGRRTYQSICAAHHAKQQ